MEATQHGEGAPQLNFPGCPASPSFPTKQPLFLEPSFGPFWVAVRARVRPNAGDGAGSARYGFHGEIAELSSGKSPGHSRHQPLP